MRLKIVCQITGWNVKQYCIYLPLTDSLFARLRRLEGRYPNFHWWRA